MKFPASTIAAIAVLTTSSTVIGYAAAFQPTVITTVVGRRSAGSATKGLLNYSSQSTSTGTTSKCGSGCHCPRCCNGSSGCHCSRCGFAAGSCRCVFFTTTTRSLLASSATQLFSSSSVDAAAAEVPATTVDAQNDVIDNVPAVVEALDGIESEAEAHNVNRPARQSIGKTTTKRFGDNNNNRSSSSSSGGKPLSEFTVGDTVTGTVKTLTAYGAFVDIGAETDGLLHISNLSAAFVANVKDVLQPGQECSVRILEINPDKKQLALTMLTPAEETQQEANKKQSSSSNSSSGGGGSSERSSNRSNVKANNAILNQLMELDIDPDQFVTGTVVNIVEFGAFVRIDCSQFDDTISGEIDGLVHVSQLQGGGGRVAAVTDVVQEGEEVQVRLLGMDGQKVSLTMMSVADEQALMDDNDSKGGDNDRGGYNDYNDDEKYRNKDWIEVYEKVMADQPPFRNGAVLWEKKKSSKK